MLPLQIFDSSNVSFQCRIYAIAAILLESFDAHVVIDSLPSVLGSCSLSHLFSQVHSVH